MNNSEIKLLNLESIRPFSNDGFIESNLAILDEFQKLPIPNEPRRVDGLIMGLGLKGKAQYTVGTEERMITMNDVIIINDNQVMDNYMISPDFEGIALIISNEFFNESIKGVDDISSLFIFSRTHPVFNLNEDEAQLIVWYYDMLKMKVNEQGNHFRTEIVRSLFKTMIYDISNIIYKLAQISEKKRTRGEVIFNEFIKLVETNFRNERRVGWYAKQICISPKYLSETISTVSKRTPNEWIDRYVILEVRVLLKSSNKSIKQISDELHFASQSFLGKFFKTHVGMSPSQYRKL